MAAIGTITIPDHTVWLDRDAWSAVHRHATRSIDGGLLRQRQAILGGRPVTLDLGWVTRSTLQDLEDLRDATGSFTLILPGGETMTCRFAPGEPLSVAPVVQRPEYADGDMFGAIVSLVTSDA